MLESIIFALNPEKHLLVEQETFIFEIRAEVEEGTVTPEPQTEEATVAGALLGAKFGYSNIPPRWVEGLVYREELWAKVERLMALMSSI